MPQLLLVEIPRCIGLNIGLNMEFLIELFKENALLKSPSRRVLYGVYVPALGNDLIFNDAAVADERVDTIRRHYRS